MFFDHVAIIMATFSKKDWNYRNSCAIRLHDADLEHSLVKEKKIDVHPDLALGILKMLIRVCFHDALQLAVR